MSAPSFSSFSPSFKSFPDLNAGSSNESKPPGDDVKQRKKHKKRDRRDRVDSTGDKRSKRHGEGSNDQTVSVDYTGQFLEPEPLHSRPLFYSDRKGDLLNVKYGSLHAGDIPKYHLVGRGRKILGLSNVWTAAHRANGIVELSVGGRRNGPTLTDSSTRHILKAPPTRTLINLGGKDRYKYKELDGFLRISSTSNSRDLPSYKDIERVEHNGNSDDSTSSSGAEEDSGSEDSDYSPISSRQTTLKSIEECLAADPSSIESWLSLLSHTLSTVPIDSPNAFKVRSEITIAVLLRAFSAHPTPQRSRKLRLKYLRAAEEIWDLTKLLDEWEEVLKLGDIELWMAWFDWQIRTACKSVDEVVEAAIRVLSALPVDDENGKLRVFWRTAVAFSDAGYVERATALFQAQAELFFKNPPNLQKSSTRNLSFEAFWESEVPRLGDPNAMGWATWEAAGRPEDISAVGTSHNHQHSDAPDPYARWAADELLADRSELLPTRSTDEADSDPYATIMFSDIQPLLLALNSLHAKHTFRLIWLSFLGLHIPGFEASLSENASDNTDDRWSSTYMRSSPFLSSIFPQDIGSTSIADAQAGALVGRKREFSSAFGPVKQWGYGVVDPLDPIGSEKWTMWTKTDVGSVDAELTREIFRQCRLPGYDVEWDILHVGFEAAWNTKNAIKVSKFYLATAQDSLPHWAAHARLERLRGRLDEARKIYRTILASAVPNNSAVGMLWWDWAEMEWCCDNLEAAQDVVLHSAGVAGNGGAGILRAKRYLENTAAQLPGKRWKERLAWSNLRALLELLTSSTTAALSVYEMQLAALKERTLAHECLTVALLQLLYKHGTLLRNPMPQTLLRDRALKGLEIYPSNTLILGLFLEAERGHGLWGRVRLMLCEGMSGDISKEKDVSRRVAEVWAVGWEKGRWKAEEERVRNGLSVAVQDERTRGSSTLWHIYLEFEIRTGKLQKAKKLLFRAVKECPLVKDLYLLAFGPLRPVFSARELDEWAETMAERGIRMRRGLEDVLAGWIEAAPSSQVQMRKDTDDGEDEIEYNARELRRLMPF